MWIILIVAALVVLLVGWRVMMLQRGGDSSRPIDSGHPHLTDVDPHDGP